MLNTSSINQTDNFQVLMHLFWLRNLLIMMQLIVIFSSINFLGMHLPFEVLMLVISVATLFNLLIVWRLKQSFPVADIEITVNLLFDCLVLGALLYYTGGPGNPFVSLFLVPIALAASYVGRRSTIIIAAVCIGLYSFLMVNHHQLPSVHGRFGGDFNLHVIGMWINFILSSIVVVIFVSGLAKQARQHMQKLADQESQRMRNEYIVSLGTLATGTAHEISTPLSNIGMMADELANSPEDSALVKDFAEGIRQQQQHCVAQLDKLRAAADADHQAEAKPLSDYLKHTLERWSAMRPDIKVERNLVTAASPLVCVDPTIDQTIISLLNNAADASLDNDHISIIVSAETSKGNLYLHIDDFGKGFSQEYLEMAGKMTFSSKSDGMGIGLLLSHASLARYDGKIKLHKNETGMRTSVCIPLDKLKARENKTS